MSLCSLGMLMLWCVAGAADEPRSTTLQDFDRGHKGFSFSQGKQIAPDNPREFPLEIDLYFDLPHGLIMNNSASGPIFKGKGGIVDMGAKPLKAIKEAPLRGNYKVGLSPRELIVGHTYCVRTADGKHVAKFQITNFDQNEETLSFSWVYQPKDTNKFDDGK